MRDGHGASSKFLQEPTPPGCRCKSGPCMPPMPQLHWQVQHSCSGLRSALHALHANALLQDAGAGLVIGELDAHEVIGHRSVPNLMFCNR